MNTTELKQALKTPYNRVELINLIYKHSNEEFEDIADVWDLAGETESQLAGRIENIIAYYDEN